METESRRPIDPAPRSSNSLCTWVPSTWWAFSPCDHQPNDTRTLVRPTWWGNSPPCKIPWWCHTAYWFDWRNQQLKKKRDMRDGIYQLERYKTMKIKKDDLLLTATHSFKSSPSGSITANRKFPEPNVAAACFIKSYWCVPSGIFFFGLKVFEDLLPLERKKYQILIKIVMIFFSVKLYVAEIDCY